jgi:hypothetical protein
LKGEGIDQFKNSLMRVAKEEILQDGKGATNKKGRPNASERMKKRIPAIGPFVAYRTLK